MLVSFSNVQAKDLFEYQWSRLVYVIVILMLVSFSNVQAKDLFEYQWSRLVYVIVILMLVSFSNVQAKDLFEYQWPQESGRERSSSVVECLTRDRRAAGSSLTGVTALWSLSKTHLS